MAVSSPDLIARTRAHYRDKFAQHGATPLGVDWNGAVSQLLHFEQLLKLLPAAGRFTVNDFGCGYGALADMLFARYRDFDYLGCDLNAEMVAAAGLRHAEHADIRFEVADRPTRQADFGLASGIFTLRLGRDDDQCRADMVDAIHALDGTSQLGFGFNCLTSYSDADKMKDYLYYPDPCDLFDLCKRRFSQRVALLHDYGLYAFTILVRKGAAAVA